MLRGQLSDRLQAGQYAAAAAMIEGLDAPGSEAGAVRPGCLMALWLDSGLERRAWRELLGRPRTPPAEAESLFWYTVGLAAAHVSFGGVGPEAGIAREAVRRLDAFAARADRRGVDEARRLWVQAAIAASQEEREEMALLLVHLRSLDSATFQAVTVVPSDELAGDLWFAVDRYAEARRSYAAALERHPRRAHALLGIARASVELDDRSGARGAYAQLLEVWRDADPDVPGLTEARDFLSQGAPRDGSRGRSGGSNIAS